VQKEPVVDAPHTKSKHHGSDLNQFNLLPDFCYYSVYGIVRASMNKCEPKESQPIAKLSGVKTRLFRIINQRARQGSKTNNNKTHYSSAPQSDL
jgi:hypothetical protein